MSINPTILDLNSDDPSLLRRLAQQSLRNTASPMFMIENFGFEQLLQSVVQKASSKSKERNQLVEGRTHFDLKTEDTEDDPLFDEFKDEMKALANRVAIILFGEEACAGVEFDGPLSVKSYIGDRGKIEHTKSSDYSDSDVRLGAHIDGNMFTLLWSNAPGLQVLKPDKDVAAEDLMFYGMPLVGVDPSLDVKDDDFVEVEANWASGGLMLVTVGRSWFGSSNTLTNDNNLHVKCPVLHRVSFSDREEVRYSVPYLVSVVNE
jgi:hypothetical protein